MKRILHFIMIGSFAMAISACSRPPVPEGDLTPPVNGGGKSGHSAAQKLAIFPVLITDAGVDQRLGGCAHHIACIRQGALARQGQSVDARVIY